MSYQQGINQFIPNYIVKSDYLPSKVIEGNNPKTSELVTPIPILAPTV